MTTTANGTAREEWTGCYDGGWAGLLVPEAFAHPAIKIRAQYTLGTLKLDLGDRAGGRDLLQKFLQRWDKADWDLPEVRDARARLASS